MKKRQGNVFGKNGNNSERKDGKKMKKNQRGDVTRYSNAKSGRQPRQNEELSDFIREEIQRSKPLSREKELVVTRKIVSRRRKYQREILSNAGIQRILMKRWRGYLNKEIPYNDLFSGKTSGAEEQEFSQKLQDVLREMETVLRANRLSYILAATHGNTPENRSAEWKKILDRRRQVVQMIESLPIHFDQFKGLEDSLREFDRKGTALYEKLALLEREGEKDWIQWHSLRKDFLQHYRRVLETPTTLRRRIDRVEKKFKAYEKVENFLVQSNYRLVASIVKQFKGGEGIIIDDIYQTGIKGLLTAIKSFDPERGNRLSTYATVTIEQTIKRSLYKEEKTVSLTYDSNRMFKTIRFVENRHQRQGDRKSTTEELAEETGYSVKDVRFSQNLLPINSLSLDRAIKSNKDKDDEEEVSHTDRLPDWREELPDVIVERKMMLKDIEKFMAKLDKREQMVIRLRYPLDGSRSYTQAEVGRDFIHLSRERVRQIEQSALRKLYSFLNGGNGNLA